MKRFLKGVAERATGFNAWIERPSDRAALIALIRSLHPRTAVAPLVRIGSDGDGGYLVPDDLADIKACVSPGVSIEIGFDAAMAQRRIDVYMADASVDGPPHEHPRFRFSKKFLDVINSDVTIRLDDFCKSLPFDAGNDLILQMDIEGSEWSVLLDCSPETLSRFRIIIIEFHDLEQMFGRFAFGLMSAALKKVLRTHSVVHSHPNNVTPIVSFDGIDIPPLIELTFYRNDRPFAAANPIAMPHPLDRDNVPGNPAVLLPALWYR